MRLNKLSSSVVRDVAGIAAVFLFVSAPLGPSRAGDASNWDKDLYSASRLVAGAVHQQGGVTILRAGIEIALQAGWKTYWRYPGDSGIPPRFDFAGSTNVQSATVAWPAPKRFKDGGGMSIGYENGVIFPVHVVPHDPAKPVLLRMKVDYAVCRNLCVPAVGSAELELSGTPGAFDAALATAEARVPKSASVGDQGTLAIRNVMREDASPLPRIVVDIVAPPATHIDLFAEGPTPDWALPLPTPVAQAPAGLYRFVFELDGLPPNTKPNGAVLTLTAVSEHEAIEVKTRLD